MNDEGGCEVRGVIAKNVYGEFCFFSHSRANGVFIGDADGLLRAVEEAPARRFTHTEIAVLDPPEDVTVERMHAKMYECPAHGVVPECCVKEYSRATSGWTEGAKREVVERWCNVHDGLEASCAMTVTEAPNYDIVALS